MDFAVLFPPPASIPEPRVAGVFAFLYFLTAASAVLLGLSGLEKRPGILTMLLATAGTMPLLRLTHFMGSSVSPLVQYVLLFSLSFVLGTVIYGILRILNDSGSRRRSRPENRWGSVAETLVLCAVCCWALRQLSVPMGLCIVLFCVQFVVSRMIRQYLSRNRPAYPTYANIQKPVPGHSVRRGVMILSIYVSLLYLFWRILFTVPAGKGIPAVVFAVLLLACETMDIADSILNNQIVSRRAAYPLPETGEGEIWPEVDVFVATYNESRTLLYKTLHGCLNMEYPDPSRVHIYLCDDGNRPEIRKLAQDLQVGYLTRTSRAGAKAGNLNNALKHTASPLVVTFDADMIPRRDFLKKTIPYFMHAQRRNAGLPEEEQIPLGFVQTPQAFYNEDLFQHHLYKENLTGNEQDYFFREIQPAKTASNSVIYAGSNTVISRAALEAVGGFFTKAITEDFATGLLIEGNGYVSLALPEPLAFGLSPEDFPSLIQQRIRWARGVINVLYQINIFFTNRFSAGQKISYGTAIFFWIRSCIRMVYLVVPILAAFFRIPFVDSAIGPMLCFWVPYLIMQYVFEFAMTGSRRSSPWTNIYETVLCPFLAGPVLLEILGISLKTFKVTDKDKERGTHFSWRYMLPFLVLTLLDAAGLLAALLDLFHGGSSGGVVTLFWLGYNFILLCICLLFVLGRKNETKVGLRKSVISCELSLPGDGEVLKGVVVGLSEQEMDVVFHGASAFPCDSTPCQIRLETDTGMTVVTAVCTGSQKQKGLTVTRFAILEFPDLNQFLSLLYDRDLAYESRQRQLFLSPALLQILKQRFQDR